MARYNAMTMDFEEVTIFEKPALFTPLRINRSTVPDGFYLYEVRHDDDGLGDAVQIARCIVVNHWGSIITQNQIQLPSDGYLDIEPEDLDYSIGDCRSLVEFMSKFPITRGEVVKMRRLTDNDLVKISGNTIQGYHMEDVRIKRGYCSDSDHYGIVLGKNNLDHYVTWQFHLLEDETISVYWGHYFMENREAAVRDFHTRDTDDERSKFKVTITETLKMTVELEAEDQWQAEQTVSDNWKAGEYVLGADHFTDVKFEAVPTTSE